MPVNPTVLQDLNGKRIANLTGVREKSGDGGKLEIFAQQPIYRSWTYPGGCKKDLDYPGKAALLLKGGVE